MLDGLKREKSPSQPEVVRKPKPVVAPVDRKRFIDTFKIRRANKIKILRVIKTNGKIKLKRSRESKQKRRLVWLRLLIVFAILTICAGLFSQTNIFRVAVLISKINNQSVIIGFQNSAELRPTGGFWGSFALLDIKNDLTDSSIFFETNPYKKNQKFAELPKDLPTPLKQTWPDKPTGFVNANWAIDFPEAAKTIEWYFGEGWDKKADGVIAVSSLTLIDLLRLTGAITLDDQTQITSDNFTEIMSQKIDTEYWQSEENKITNEPKTILKDIAPQIIERAKSLPRLTLYRFLLDQMNKGRILAYFNNNSEQLLAEKIGISGKILPYDTDFLSINNANLNGGKSSLNIKQDINYSVSSEPSDVIVYPEQDRGASENQASADVIASPASSGTWQSHNGSDAIEQPVATLKITRSYPDNAWPDILNRNYTRVVAPLGSKFISAQLDGIDTSSEVETLDESGRTTFGFWFSVGPTESKTAVLEYELPFSLKNSRNYSLILQKQPGTLADEVEISAFGKNLFSGSFDQSSAKL